jgi:putative membrane protein
MTYIDWLMPWEFSPTFLVFFFILAGLYFRNVALDDIVERRATLLQQGSFWSGMLIIYIVTQTGFDFYAEHQFFMHRFQHLVQHHLGPFLIVLGVPEASYRHWGERFCIKAGTARAGLSLRVMRALLRYVTHPIVSAVLFNLLVLFWLIPGVHLASMLDWRLYRVMNFSMLINGLLFWAAVLRGAAPFRPVGKALSPLRRVILMVAVVPVQIVIGAVLAMAPVELYSVYAMCGRIFSNITGLQDQQIGGLILWMPGAMMSVVGILLVLGQRFTSRGIAAESV